MERRRQARRTRSPARLTEDITHWQARARQYLVAKGLPSEWVHDYAQEMVLDALTRPTTGLTLPYCYRHALDHLDPKSQVKRQRRRQSWWEGGTRPHRRRGVPRDDAAPDVLLREHVHAALTALPTIYAEMVWRQAIEGATPAELARAYGLTPATVATYLCWARRRLRQALAHVQGEIR